MPDVEERLDSVEKAVQGLRGEVGELRGEVQKLRVLGERNASEITLIAEVQGHHSKVLDEIRQDLAPLKGIPALMAQIAQHMAPLKDIRDFMDRVAHEHEARIIDVEKRVGIRE